MSFIEDISRNLRQYGYILNEENDLVPLIINYTLIPADLPSPCNCLKCERPHGCPCANCIKPILQMRGETILQKYFKLLMNDHARSVSIGNFLLILSKNMYIYLGKI